MSGQLCLWVAAVPCGLQLCPLDRSCARACQLCAVVASPGPCRVGWWGALAGPCGLSWQVAYAVLCNVRFRSPACWKDQRCLCWPALIFCILSNCSRTHHHPHQSKVKQVPRSHLIYQKSELPTPYLVFKSSYRLFISWFKTLCCSVTWRLYCPQSYKQSWFIKCTKGISMQLVRSPAPLAPAGQQSPTEAAQSHVHPWARHFHGSTEKHICTCPCLFTYWKAARHGAYRS